MYRGKTGGAWRMAVTFREVKADILLKITQGVWPPGDLIPNEVDLAESYGCARATVNRAVQELADDGIVERRRKAGTRVRMAPVRQARFNIPIVRQEIEDRGAVYRYTLVNRELRTAPDWLGKQLKIPPEGRVLHLACVHYADATPFQFEDRWINLDVLPEASEADFTNTGPNEWLVATIPFSDVEISFLATQADTALAQHLGCTARDALFQTERITWWQGRAITYVRLTYQPGHKMTTRY